VKDLLNNPKSTFYVKNKTLIEPGWQAAFKKKAASQEQAAPLLAANDKYKLVDVKLKSAETSPPPRYSESTLPKAMETIARQIQDPKLRKLLKNAEGIGTPATRATIVETLLARGYVETSKGVYKPTKKGNDIIQIVPSWLSNPETTAVWEDRLVQICDQRDDSQAVVMRDQFVTKQIEKIEALIVEMDANYRDKKGDKVQPTPSKVSPKMKEFIKSIGKQKNVCIPAGTLTHPAKAKAFLDEHAGSFNSSESNGLSQKQLDYLERILKSLPADIAVPEGIRSDKKKAKSFIDNHKKYLPPSEKQIKLAKSLAENLKEGEKPPENFLVYATECSKFIDEAMKRSRKK
jgi:DNA topoisomerase-3